MVTSVMIIRDAGLEVQMVTILCFYFLLTHTFNARHMRTVACTSIGPHRKKKLLLSQTAWMAITMASVDPSAGAGTSPKAEGRGLLLASALLLSAGQSQVPDPVMGAR